jgi:hypothetical protein
VVLTENSNMSLLAKEGMVLQGTLDRLTEIGRCNGIEKNVEKTKVMRISRQPSPLQTLTDQKQVENVEYFKYVGSTLTYDARCTCEIKSKNATLKATFMKRKKTLHQYIGIKFKKEASKLLHWEHSFVGSECWTL